MILPQVDTEMKQVAALVAMRDSLNPDVKLSLDELGTILPDVFDSSFVFFLFRMSIEPFSRIMTTMQVVNFNSTLSENPIN
jgi:hypothetical protein